MGGSARELGDMRRAGEKVGVCCQALRSSLLLKRCISTTLAVGNLLNRGTARGNARAVPLPESLLKLDDLRSTHENVDFLSENKAPTLLDFIAQALIDASGTLEKANELRRECDTLLSRVRAASSVALEEAEITTRQVCAEATRVRDDIVHLNKSQVFADITDQVRLICEEAELALTLITRSKEELIKTQTWCSAKPGAKCNEWFLLWGQFLEQLSRALANATQPEPAVETTAFFDNTQELRRSSLVRRSPI